MLTPDQVERYSRHLLLKEVGGQGQQKLLDAKVLVIGAGGLGAPALLYLAAAGVGRLGVVDDDTVALSNLQRQIIHNSADLGRPKTDSAREAVAAINPDVTFDAHEMRLNADNAEELIGAYDLVLDGCDNFETRFAVNQACFTSQTPLISAAVGRFDGQLSTFKAYDRSGPRLPCYQCLVPEAPPPGAVGSCEEEGVMGALTGVIGSLAALEALKELLGLGESLAGKLLIYNGLTASMRVVRLPADPACPVCGEKGA